MEAGWYRDPAPPNPAFPTTLRYWDGREWTTEVKAASRREREAWHAELAHAHAEQAAQSWEQAIATGRATPEQLDAASGRFSTPDGQPLSGWWRRVGAVLIDGLLTSAVAVALGWQWLSRMVAAYTDFLRQATQNARAGAPLPDTSALTQQIAGSLLALTLIFFAVELVYGVGFLKAFSATPGKMALGLEVRLRDHPGPLPWRTVLARWFTQYGVRLLRVVAGGSVFGSLYMLLDALWPLWDGKRQALHEKVARTNVVRTR
jgi:uncharacterized RDD family membrane protein YckC